MAVLPQRAFNTTVSMRKGKSGIGHTHARGTAGVRDVRERGDLASNVQHTWREDLHALTARGLFHLRVEIATSYDRDWN